MIVYHTAPVRCFPLLVEQLAGRFANAYHFRQPIVARDPADHRAGMLQHVIAYQPSLTELPRRSLPNNGFPSDVLHNGIDYVEPERLVDIDLLYGVFDGRLIRKRPGDFVFTILSHPVQHVYDLFSYLSFVNRGTVGEARSTEGVALFDEIVAAGLERFVDRFLADDLRIEAAGRTFYLIRDFFRFNFEVDYDLIGAEERIAETVAALSDRLAIPITPSERLLARHSSIALESRYRYPELCQSLRAEIALYESVLAAFTRSAAGGQPAGSPA